MKVKFTVVEHEGTKFFSGTDKKKTLLINELRASVLFEGGKVEILRGGEKIDESPSIEELGGHHNGDVGFSFLKDTFKDAANPALGIRYITAEKLNAGDDVTLSVPRQKKSALDILAEEFTWQFESLKSMQAQNDQGTDDLFAKPKPAPITFINQKTIALNYNGL